VQPTRGGPLAWRLVVGLSVKNKFVSKNYKGSRTWTDSLDKLPKVWKMVMRFGTWNTMDLREIGWDDVDWIYLAQNRDQWRALVNTIMSLRVP
jgi:hypothetical protein